MPTLAALALKVTVVLDPGEVAALAVPEGQPRTVLHIKTPDRTVTVDIASKSVRKAQATIAENGAAGVAVIIQGKLVAGDVLAEAGLVAQAKTKPAAAVAA